MKSIVKRFDKENIWTTLNPRVSNDSFSSIVVFLISLIILTIVDFFIFAKLEKQGGTNARWFGLHAFANLFVVILSIPDVVQTIVDPANSMSIQCEFSSIACTDAPVCIIAAIHLYHILAFRNLTWDDWFHHLLFAVGICSLHFCFWFRQCLQEIGRKVRHFLFQCATSSNCFLLCFRVSRFLFVVFLLSRWKH